MHHVAESVRGVVRDADGRDVAVELGPEGGARIWLEYATRVLAIRVVWAGGIGVGSAMEGYRLRGSS